MPPSGILVLYHAVPVLNTVCEYAFMRGFSSHRKENRRSSVDSIMPPGRTDIEVRPRLTHSNISTECELSQVMFLRTFGSFWCLTKLRSHFYTKSNCNHDSHQDSSHSVGGPPHHRCIERGTCLRSRTSLVSLRNSSRGWPVWRQRQR